jgi:serine/threonine protein kinase
MDKELYKNELAWKLRALHHITTGLKQLHGSDVVHQDLKPSNVVVFDSGSDNQTSKLADLGRASRSNAHCPFDELPWAGDVNYAPPEVFYSFYEVDWHKRRIASDMYLLGSLVSFLLFQTTASAAHFTFYPANFGPQIGKEPSMRLFHISRTPSLLIAKNSLITSPHLWRQTCFQYTNISVIRILAGEAILGKR